MGRSTLPQNGMINIIERNKLVILQRTAKKLATGVA